MCSSTADASTVVAASRRTEGRLELRFAADAAGRSYLADQYASYPFHVCRAQYLDPDLPAMTSIYLQSSAGGLFAGDRLSLRIAAEAGAMAHVTTPASTIVHRMPEGRAEQQAILEAGPGSMLEYLPEPVILFPEARLRSAIRLRLGEGATTILTDSFLPHDPVGADEPFGSYDSETDVVDADGRRLVLDRFGVSGEDAQKGAAGIMGGCAMQATVMAVSRAVASETLLTALRQGLASHGPSVYGAASLLPNGCGAWARILANDGADLTGAVARLWAATREAVTGNCPQPRRK